jgi:hypothetical protein
MRPGAPGGGSDESGCQAPVCDGTPIVQASTGVSAIVADEERIYYTSWGGSLRSADHDGEDIVLLADTVAYSLAADATHIYWTTNRAIRRVRKAGGPTQTVARLRESSNGLAAAFHLVVTGDHVYASTYDDGTVVRAPKAGGEIEVLASAAGGVMGGIDVAGEHLYWGEYGSTGEIVEQDLAMTGARTLGTSGAAWLRVIDGDVWASHEDPALEPTMELVRIPLDGGEPTRLARPEFSFVFEYDGRHIYWFADGGGEVLRIDPASNLVETVAANLPGGDLESVAVTADWIFLADGASPGGILRLPRPD